MFIPKFVLEHNDGVLKQKGVYEMVDWSKERLKN